MTNLESSQSHGDWAVGNPQSEREKELLAENATLKGEVEKYKDQSDYLCDRLETVSAAAENALQKLFQVHTNSGTTFSIPPYGTAQKMADTALNDLKRALGHKV